MRRVITLFHHKFGWQFIKYVIVGVSSLLVDYGTFWVSYYVLDLPLGFAAPAGLLAGFIYGFAMNKIWAFGSKPAAKHKHPVHHQFMFTLLLLGFNSLFSYLAIALMENHGLSAAIGKVITTVCITGWNFFIYKLIFKEEDITTEESNAIY